MTRNPTTTLDQEISLLEEYVQVLTKIVFLCRGTHFLEELKRKAKVIGISIPLIENIRGEELEKEDVKLLMAEASTLTPRVKEIYESYRVELGLGDHSEFLDPIHLFASELINKGLSPIVIASDLLRKLKGLKHKREREAKTPAPQPGRGKGKATETPGAKGRGKPAYQWEIDEEGQEVRCNKVGPIKLSKVGYKDGLLFKLFRCLYLQWKKGKEKGWVKEVILKRCWDSEPGYSAYVADAISKLRTALKEGLKEYGLEVQGEIIEFNGNKKAPAWRLL